MVLEGHPPHKIVNFMFTITSFETWLGLEVLEVPRGRPLFAAFPAPCHIS